MHVFQAKQFDFPLGKRSYLMGILNVTPDSFSDGGQYLKPQQAYRRALQMQKDGADILDIGPQSTRPGAVAIDAKEEIRRLAPVLDALRGEIHIPISVDTFYPATAEFALRRGVAIINDVSGVLQPDMARLIRQHQAGWVVMHNGGGALQTPAYPQGIVVAVREFFQAALAQAESWGIARTHICLDPGFGFGKCHEDNIKLLAQLHGARIRDVALLAAASRKRFVTQASQAQDLGQQDAATLAAHTLALVQGADIIRVHNVAMARAAAAMTDVVKGEDAWIKY